MADLTTVDGQQIVFNPAAILALVDRDLQTGAVVSCIYGLTKGVLRVSETVDQFMHRLSLSNEFAQLTRPTGAPVWIRGSAVVVIRAPLPNEYVAGVNSVVTAGSLEQGVQELPANAKAAVNQNGGLL